MADSENRCTFEELTTNCEVFSRRPLRLPDGTSLPAISQSSPELAVQPISTATVSSLGEDAALQMAQRQWEFRLDLLELLNQENKFRLSRQAVLYFGNHPDILEMVFSDDRQDGDVVVPWPLDGRTELGSGVSLRRVKVAEVRQYFETSVSPRIRDQVKSSIRRWTELSNRYPSSFDYRVLEPATLAAHERNVARVESVFKRAREKVEEVLLAGRQEKDLTEAELGQVKKVRDLRLRFPPINSGSCQGVMGNAYYFSADNTVNVCPQLLNYPELSLAVLLGHEVGHAVDPCNSQFGYWQINKELAARLSPTRPPPEVATNRARSIIMTTVVGISRGIDGDRTALPFEILTNNADDLKYFEQLGLLKPVARGIPFLNYPLTDVYRCLTSPQGGGFREVNVEDMSRMATEVTRYRSELLGRDYDSATDHLRIMETFGRYPQCSGSSKASQMGEAVADWFGAEVLADHLKGRSLATEAERVSAIGLFAAQLCLDRKQQTVPSGPDIEVMGAALRDWRAYKGEHPPSVRRINEVILRHPEVRRALGCPAGDSHCVHRRGSRSGDNGESQRPEPGVVN